MTTCSTCQSWGLKNIPMARNGLAPCALGKPYTALRPDNSCERHRPIDQAAADARAGWLSRIDQKHKQGVSA